MKPSKLALLVGVLSSLALAPASVASQEPLRLEVTQRTNVHHMFTGTAVSHGLRITNLTESPITIERGILIERRVSSGWVQDTAIQAVDKCEKFRRPLSMESADPDQSARNAGRCALGWLLVWRAMPIIMYAERHTYFRNTAVCRGIPRRPEGAERRVFDIGR